MSLYHQKLESYEPRLVREAIEAGFANLGGLEQLLGTRQKVLLKPNFVSMKPKETNVCTRPEVVLATVEAFLDRGVQVAIGESPGFGSTEAAVELLGLKEPLEKRQVNYFTFSKATYFTTDNPKFRRLGIAAELDDYDGVVNLAKIKTHCQTQFSGAVKNLYGCVPGKRKAYRHLQAGDDEAAFMQMLVDNYRQVNAFLHLADGVEVLHKNGPTSGDSLPFGSLLVGDDGVQMDWEICRLIGLDPMSTLQFQCLGVQPDSEVLGVSAPPVLEFEHAAKLPVSFNPLRLGLSVLRQSWSRLRRKI